MPRSSVRVALVIAPLAAAACLSGGCYSDYSDNAAAWIRLNPSPNIDTLAQRPVDIDNNLAVVWDTNWRMFNQDLGRAMLLDRPSMLTIEPMPHQ